MLTWVGFIGKLIDLVVTKIIGKQVDLKLDDRKRAARAFLGLHDALTTLGAIVSEFLAYVQPVLEGTQPRLYRAKGRDLATRGDAASRSLVEALHRLHRVIGIYDPQLALFLRGIVRGKKDMLMGFPPTTSFASKMRFELAPNPESVFAIRYSAPAKALMEANLEDSYAAASRIAERLGSGGSDWIDAWPDDVLLSLVEGGSVEGWIPDNGVTQIRELHEMVSRYAPLFAAAQEQLEGFIRKTFAIEDLL